MAKYAKVDKSKVRMVSDVQEMIAATVKNETGAEVEVTISLKGMMVYTEDLERVESIKDLLGATGYPLESVSEYEAEEDMPAGVTLMYGLV